MDQPVVRKVSNPVRMTIAFSVSSSTAPRAWKHLLQAMKEFEDRYKVSLDDLDIKSIPAGTAN